MTGGGAPRIWSWSKHFEPWLLKGENSFRNQVGKWNKNPHAMFCDICAQNIMSKWTKQTHPHTHIYLYIHVYKSYLHTWINICVCIYTCIYTYITHICQTHTHMYVYILYHIPIHNISILIKHLIFFPLRVLWLEITNPYCGGCIRPVPKDGVFAVYV